MLTNPWFVGIGGSVLGGLLVTLITRMLFSRRENREYLLRVATANNEILYSVRPSISESKLPSRGILDSLIASTARKHEVDRDDLYGIDQLVEDITKEIMDSGFLSAEQKLNFCEEISSLKRQPVSIAEEVAERKKLKEARAESAVSWVIGLMAAFASILGFVSTIALSDSQLAGRRLGSVAQRPITGWDILPIVMIAITVPILSSILFIAVARARRRRASVKQIELKATSRPRSELKASLSVSKKKSNSTQSISKP